MFNAYFKDKTSNFSFNSKQKNIFMTIKLFLEYYIVQKQSI